MAKDHSQICRQISDNLRKLRKDLPDTMQAFSALAYAAGRDGALDKKTKELIALALGVGAHCDGCIGFHAEALVRLGATRQEVEEALRHGRLYGRRAVADVCRGSVRRIRTIPATSYCLPEAFNEIKHVGEALPSGNAVPPYSETEFLAELGERVRSSRVCLRDVAPGAGSQARNFRALHCPDRERQGKCLGPRVAQSCECDSPQTA